MWSDNSSTKLKDLKNLNASTAVGNLSEILNFESSGLVEIEKHSFLSQKLHLSVVSSLQPKQIDCLVRKLAYETNRP